MAGVTAVLAGAALASSAAGFAAQQRAANKAESQEGIARGTSEASAQVENARQRRRAIAQARLAQAQNQAMQSEEARSTSAARGVGSSLSTQLGANINTQRSRITTAREIGALNQSASNSLRRGQQLAGGFNLASQAFTLGASGFGSGSSNSGTSARSSVNTGSFDPGNGVYQPNGFTGVGL